MKNICITTMLLIIAAFSGFAQAKDVTVPAIPGSMEELVALRDKIATTPEGGAVTFLVAMIMYGEDKELGAQAFTLTLDRDGLSNGTVYKGFQPKRTWYEYFYQIDKFPYLGKIYVKGTKDTEAYALSAGPPAFTVTEVRQDRNGMMKVFVATTSGNMPRPILMAKNDKGLWKVKEASSMFVGPIKLAPEKKVVDDL